ncbi:MAG: sigma-70 family RNA polymerase sigma factor [Bacteroidales bacterium]|mgnify:CR=1 FL=1|nr:sigma-70 family RNA polymerase sigma factor [Bacteroidales bacterium]MDD4670255.1 sigma-70 family RNA polymerase sigma factor [Bacteroidales bacterium]
MREEEISNLCKKGDNAARKELYECYGPRLLAICIRYIGERTAAEDVLHDGFIKIFNSFDKFTYRGEGSLKAWTDRVIVNTSLEYLRKTKKIRDNRTDMSIADKYEEPPQEQIRLVPKNIILEYISELPDGYRAVFNLYTFENKSHREIARMLGINEKSSSSQLSRAKSLLAKKINTYLDAVKNE